VPDEKLPEFSIIHAFPWKASQIFFLIGSFTKDSLTYGVLAKVVAYKRVSEEH